VAAAPLPQPLVAAGSTRRPARPTPPPLPSPTPPRASLGAWRLGHGDLREAAGGGGYRSRESELVGWPIRIQLWAFNRPVRMAQVSKLFGFIFLRILHEYVLTEYPVRIRIGYVLDTYSDAD
jgi:hypothetical protein